MIIKCDSYDSDEIDDEFTELLRQIDGQRQIESALQEFEVRDAVPVMMTTDDRHPHPTGVVVSEIDEGCSSHPYLDVDEQVVVPQHSVAAYSKKIYALGATLPPVTRLPATHTDDGDVAENCIPASLASNAVPQLPKFPIVAKRNGAANKTTIGPQTGPATKSSPRKISLKKIDRNLTIARPTSKDDGGEAGSTSHGSESIETSESIAEPRRTPGTQRSTAAGDAVQGNCTSSHDVMDILLGEIKDYVAENNMVYHETSPEKAPRAPPERLPDPAGIGPLFEADASDDDSDPDVDELTPLASSGDHLGNSVDGTREEQKNARDEESADDTLESHVSPVTPKRRVRFADDHGLPLLNIFHLDRIMATEGRLVVLLLSPPERTFEFIQVEYPMDDSTTTNDLVEQLPELATNAVFQEPNCFAGVSRIRTLRSENQCNKTGGKASKSSQEEEDDNSTSDSSSSSSSGSSSSTTRGYNLPCLLDSTLLMRDVDFGNCELVLAVLDGYTPAQMVTIAFPLLLNGKIMKAVQAGRRSGRGLKYLLSGKGWRRQRQQLAMKLEEERQDWHEEFTYREWAVVDNLADSVIVFDIDLDEYAESWEEMRGLKGMSDMVGSDMTVRASNAWDCWCADFKEEDPISKYNAVALLGEGYFKLDRRPLDATSAAHVVENNQERVSLEPRDSRADAVTNREVKDTDISSSPRSVVGVQRNFGGKADPVHLPDQKHTDDVISCDPALQRDVVVPDMLLPNPDPALWDYIGGREGAEHFIFMIYSLSVIGAAGLLLSKG